MPRRSAKTKAFEDALIADAARLNAFTIKQLGYYGGPSKEGPATLAHTMEDPWWASTKTEEERAAEERRALLIAGSLWRCSQQLVQGLFDDIHALRTIESLLPAQRRAADLDQLEFVTEDSAALRWLPSAFAQHYDSHFAQKFLVVASEVSTRLAGEWSWPSCIAQELAVMVLAGLVIDYGRDHGLEIGNPSGDLYEVMLEDLDQHFLYDISSLDGDGTVHPPETGRAMAVVQGLGGSNMAFENWFVPFNAGRAVSPYAYTPALPDTPPQDAGEEGPDEEIPADERDAALDDGRLVDVSDMAEDFGIYCDTAITRAAWEALVGGEDPDAEELDLEPVSAALLAVAQRAEEDPDRRSVRFEGECGAGVDAPGPVPLVAVAGLAEGVSRLTIQLDREQRI